MNSQGVLSAKVVTGEYPKDANMPAVVEMSTCSVFCHKALDLVPEINREPLTLLKKPFPTPSPKLLVHLQALHCHSPGAHRYRCDYEGTKETLSCFVSLIRSCAGEEDG